MNSEAIEHLFKKLSKERPHPKTELNYINHYTLLITVVLSAQATDISVNKATASLFKTITSPEDMITYGEENLTKAVKSIGLYRTKAKNIMKLSYILAENYQGKIPKTRAELEALPGVGRKTANVVLNEAFGEPTIAVDTHIFRLSNRTGLAPGKTPLDVEKKLLKVIPEPYKRYAHHWLILHGRYVCKARKPLCQNCSVFDFCDYPDKAYYRAN